MCVHERVSVTMWKIARECDKGRAQENDETEEEEEEILHLIGTFERAN